ncbi:hypothetical protein JCGZ_06933 [Jatropha curcas]|uniref:Aminotransferase-like plant mobile domain-containing protein n=1 Tax=Jatropha curcas TaxID=180498 RepID=A0A067KN55_JATCU|nr:hypothetical protein JCGZ_06933 [Jatropha curcas]
MCILDGMTSEDRLLEYDGFPADDYLKPGYYASYLTTQLQARLPEVREYSQERKRHRTPAFYRAQAEADAPAGPVDAMLGDVPFPPGMEVALDPTLGLGPAIAIPVNLRQAPPQLQLDPEHATHELEIGRLRRHQSCQAAAVTRLQMEVNRLRTRLEVEGVPLDFSEEEDDDEDGSSSDDASTPPSFVRQAAVVPTGGQFDFGDNPMIRWTCPWWRIRLVTAGSMNLSYVLYACLDRSMAYFPDRINCQYGVVQRIPRIHNFESGPMTQSLLTNLPDRWRNRNTWYMGQGAMQNTVTPEYID